MNGYLLDDSDSQWAERERKRVNVSPVSRPYWLAIPVDERERIVEAVPDGHRLVIKPGYRAKPGTTDVELRDTSNSTVKGTRGYLTAPLCWWVLPKVTVTVDGEGYVRDIEEVA